MTVELPNEALNTDISMMGNPPSIHFESLHRQLQDYTKTRNS